LCWPLASSGIGNVACARDAPLMMRERMLGLHASQISDEEDEMDKARRELHKVDRRDWPPLALMYGLPWEQYFEKKEGVLFEQPAPVRVCGPARSRSSPVLC
jgi:hypothetical protein